MATIKKSHRGRLTAKAKKAGLSPLAFARKVVANPSAYSKSTDKQAQFAVNFNKGRK